MKNTCLEKRRHQSGSCGAQLSWTEAVTLVASKGVTDEVYQEARKQFSEKELVDLALAVVAINGWNRFNVAFRTVPGDYSLPIPSEW